jgi:hypothetical protein
MAYRWPAGTAFKRIDRDVEARAGPVCACSLHVCDHRYHPLWTLEGPTQVVNRRVRCPEPSCAHRGRPFSPEAAWSISMPRWWLGWDVVCWLGQRRVARHWSVSQLRAACKDTHQSRLADDTITHSIGLYQTMLAARPPDPARLAEASRAIESLGLTIDGVQPDKGHETLAVVRELTRKRVWCAAPWRSRTTEEVRRLIGVARPWRERLAKPVRVWRADKQAACVTAIASACPGTPHRDCHNHFLRDVAPPVLDMARRAQVKMRRTVRGWRAIERRVSEERRQAAAPAPPPPDESPKTEERRCAGPSAATAATPRASRALGGTSTESLLEATGGTTTEEARGADEVGAVVLGYGAAVRGLLHDSQGGPLHPPGVRMRAALQDVRDALERNLHAKKGGGPSHGGSGWLAVLTVGSRAHALLWSPCASTPQTCKRWLTR